MFSSYKKSLSPTAMKIFGISISLAIKSSIKNLGSMSLPITLFKSPKQDWAKDFEDNKSSPSPQLCKSSVSNAAEIAPIYPKVSWYFNPFLIAPYPPIENPARYVSSFL